MRARNTFRKDGSCSRLNIALHNSKVFFIFKTVCIYKISLLDQMNWLRPRPVPSARKTKCAFCEGCLFSKISYVIVVYSVFSSVFLVRSILAMYCIELARG